MPFISKASGQLASMQALELAGWTGDFCVCCGYCCDIRLLCYRMCYADPDSLTATIDRYMEIDISFAGSRECQLLSNLIEALAKGDAQKFTDCISDYDSMSKLVSTVKHLMCILNVYPEVPCCI